MPVRRYLVPFAAGVAVGITVHEYWPQIKEAAGPSLEKGLAEIREEEEAAAKSGPPAT